ncbi:MAG: BtpA/SgcQ family protein [Planctomycetes bacterium]|nr:BtpA/SgcQ family protein [Planctomycetota bacterium]
MQPNPFTLYGVVHLEPLPGAPRFAGSLDAVEQRALSDARALIDGGVDGLVVENFGDAPFFPDRVPPVTIAAMARIARAVVELARDVPVGINVLRNDARAALAVAAAVGARFVRVNVHQGAAVTDQGLLEGRAFETTRERIALAPDLRILADVRVKHAAPLGERSLAAETNDLVLRGLADVVLVTGEGTGRAVDLDALRTVRGAAAGRPVWIASGLTVENAREFSPHADGAIVGSAFEREGKAGNPVEIERVRALVRALATRRDG